MQLIVTVKRLNKRKKIPVHFPEPENIVGEVKQNFTFEGEAVDESQLPNPELGKWYKDQDGYFYWGGGLSGQLPATEAPVSQPAFQWFDELQIDQIWAIAGEKGDKATVAIIDTGYDATNAELPEPLKFKLFVNNPSNTATIQDQLWHGTFCTSIVACRNETVKIGIAPECQVLIGKVSLKGELKNINFILDAIKWAIAEGADIISISMGVELTNPLQISQLQTQLDQILKDQNVLIFAACGDNFSDHVVAKEFYPASLDQCISIGTINNNLIDKITVRSDKTVLHTLGIDIDSFMLNGRIAKQSGTSMSVPMVAGLMALGVSATKKKNNGSWAKDELLDKLISTANPVSGFANKKIIHPLKFIQSI